MKRWLSPEIKNPNPRTYYFDLPFLTGERIQWLSWPNREVIGWKEETPRPGDLIYSAMESGKTAKYEFTSVERMPYPMNLFFAKVRDLGYA